MHRINCWKTAKSKPNTQNLKPPASITKKLQKFQNGFLVQWKFLKIFIADNRNFNIKLRHLEAKLKSYFCQKLRLQVTDNIFTIKNIPFHSQNLF